MIHRLVHTALGLDAWDPKDTGFLVVAGSIRLAWCIPLWAVFASIMSMVFSGFDALARQNAYPRSVGVVLLVMAAVCTAVLAEYWRLGPPIVSVARDDV